MSAASRLIVACLLVLLGLTSTLCTVANEPAELVEEPITAEEREHWAYQPLAPVELPASDETSSEVSHAVDRFWLAALRKAGVEPLPKVGKAALLRRVTFDLTGLPPTPAEVHAFLADNSADAFERVVDRLLASPAYGERWAQHWLDLARFAETDGFEHDLVRPNAWRYRDWVVDALNRDLPFDEFVRLQIAGDLLRPGDSQAAIATGFLLCGPDMPDLNLQDERRHVVLNEITATVGSVFLAMQFGCAQCHDHKYDPIRQADFYRLRAFFESADIFRDHPVPTAAELAARRAAEAAVDPKFAAGQQRRKELLEAGRNRFREQNPDVQPSSKQVLAQLSPAEREELTELETLLKTAPRLPDLPLGRVVHEGSPRPARLYLRGDFRNPGPVVPCSFPRVLEPADNTTQASHSPSRIELANWLTSPANPLVARVSVNRLWGWHFGAGLAPSPSDFGLMGGEPTHPELLDWLAARFMADGWSMKQVHRLLVTSRFYRTASGPFDESWSADELVAARSIWNRSYQRDPEDQLLWRRRRIRLDGEALRDAMLAASGGLSSRRGGPGVRPPLPPEVTTTLLKDQWNVNGDAEDHRRRSLYLFVRRNLRYPLFDVFDRPDTNASCALRHESTTATQSLTLLNSAFSLESARRLAAEVSRQADAPAARVEAAYLRVLGRPASAEEIRLGEEFLARPGQPSGGQGTEDPPATLVDYCLALFNASEFVYLD